MYVNNPHTDGVHVMIYRNIKFSSDRNMVRFKKDVSPGARAYSWNDKFSALAVAVLT